MKTYTTTVINFKGNKQELIEAVKKAKFEARKQVEGTNILPSLPKFDFLGRSFVEVTNNHVTSTISDFNLVPDTSIYEGTITYGVDSSWKSIQELNKEI